MQLDILARGHMPDTGGILLGQFCNPAQLIPRQSAERDLDTDHLDTGLPLAVNAVLETEGPEQIDRDFARNHAHRLSLEGLNLLDNGRRNGLCLDRNSTEWCKTHR
jgi:hypothetical protein